MTYLRLTDDLEQRIAFARWCAEERPDGRGLVQAKLELADAVMAAAAAADDRRRQRLAAIQLRPVRARLRAPRQSRKQA